MIILSSQVVKGDPAMMDLDPVALWQEVKHFNKFHIESLVHMKLRSPRCWENLGIANF